jgi:glycosyltransferase involved in cell wall biosynthesis
LPGLLAALEAQDLEPHRFEVVIVDNGSSDDTRAVLDKLAEASDLNIRVLEIVRNDGPAAARNLGWQSCTPPYVAFIDDDCIPGPTWLRAGLDAISVPSVGVVQGHTEPGDGPLGDWTLQRTVRAPTPFFEGCNVFYRRAALEAARGFDEDIGWYGEDTALGWGVIELGFGRGYADGALVVHPLEERPLRWHVKSAFQEGNMIAIARRHPAFALDAFHTPRSFHPHDARAALALAALLLAPRHPWSLALVYPWYRLRKARPRGDHPLTLLAQRALVDGACVTGMLVASVRERHLVI